MLKDPKSNKQPPANTEKTPLNKNAWTQNQWQDSWSSNQVQKKEDTKEKSEGFKIQEPFSNGRSVEPNTIYFTFIIRDSPNASDIKTLNEKVRGEMIQETMRITNQNFPETPFCYQVSVISSKEAAIWNGDASENRMNAGELKRNNSVQVLIANYNQLGSIGVTDGDNSYCRVDYGQLMQYSKESWNSPIDKKLLGKFGGYITAHEVLHALINAAGVPQDMEGHDPGHLNTDAEDDKYPNLNAQGKSVTATILKTYRALLKKPKNKEELENKLNEYSRVHPAVHEYIMYYLQRDDPTSAYFPDLIPPVFVPELLECIQQESSSYDNVELRFDNKIIRNFEDTTTGDKKDITMAGKKIAYLFDKNKPIKITLYDRDVLPWNGDDYLGEVTIYARDVFKENAPLVFTGGDGGKYKLHYSIGLPKSRKESLPEFLDAVNKYKESKDLNAFQEAMKGFHFHGTFANRKPYFMIQD